MIEVLLNKPEFEYDSHSLIKAFFPEQYVGVSAEKKEYDDGNLPPYLHHDHDAMTEGKYPYDCLWCELYGSINAAYTDGDISEDHAWYLRERYLEMERL